MTVSVIVPTLNSAGYLAEALESIESQRFGPLEVLVVDGGSIDGTLQVAASFAGVRTLPQEGSGLPGAWNTGLASARGELIAFLDSDDRWLEGKLMSQTAILDANPGVACVLTRMRFVLEPGLPIPPGFRPELLDGDHLAQMPSALLARRAAFELVGTFDERWPVAADVDWFKRLGESGLRVEAVPEVLVEKRVHDRNLSLAGGASFNRELVEVLREAVARRRDG